MEIQRAEAKRVFFSDIKPGETFRNTGGMAVYLRAYGQTECKYNAINLVSGVFCRFWDADDVERVNGTFVEGEE